MDLNASDVEVTVEDSNDHVWIELPSPEKPLLVGCIYRSPSKDYNKESCLKSANITSQLVKTAYERNNNLVIAGDFNYKEIDWTNEFAPPGKEHQTVFINALQDCYMYQHVTEPTRHRPNESPNLLDLILSSDESLIRDLKYLPPLGESDHICIRFNVLCGKAKAIEAETAGRNVFKADYEAIIDELNRYDWVNLFNSTFVEDYNHFFNILEKIMMKFTLLRTPKKRRRICT